MELKLLIKEVKATKPTSSVWKNKFDSLEYKQASKLNSILFGMPLNRVKNCSCVNDLFMYISNLNENKINKIKETMESKFKLKESVGVILLHGINMELSNANMTDEKALTLLKKYPIHIKSFEAYPQNWEELIDAEPETDKPSEVLDPVTNEQPKQVETPAGENEVSLEELKKLSKKILKKMANEVALKTGVDAPHHASGVAAFAEFIIENK